MRTVFKVLAFIIALEVVVQAAMIAFAVAGIGLYVDGGGTLDEAAMEAIFDGDLTFTGIVGMMIHGMNGMMVIPLLALLFFISSFFSKVPGGWKWGLGVLVLVIVQVSLGLFGHENAYFGMLHGANALILFTTALMAGLRARKVTTPEAPSVTAERELV